MKHMIFRHRVEDFDRWLAVFDEDSDAQNESGLRIKYVLRDARDPQVVVLWFEVDDPEKAMAFTQTAEAAETGERAGSVGDMETWVFQESD